MKSTEKRDIKIADAVETDVNEIVEQPRVAPVPLDRVLNSIRSDSQRTPQAYLNESVIPGGGE